MKFSYSSALFTDAYQISMMQTYFETQMTDLAVFELYVRNLPQNRNFLIAAGIDQALDFLETVQFTEEEVQWLRSTQRYSDLFLDSLKDFRFTGCVEGVPEGSIIFQNEPILKVIAPLPEAQFVESRLINLIQFQSMIASKAIRSHLVADGKQLMDFGLRRSHGAEAGLMIARASFLAGFHGTSTLSSAKEFGIPYFGTLAHSFIQAHPSEEAAFKRYALSQKGPVIFLIDTYNIKAAATLISTLTPQLRAQGAQVLGVRIDSGDLVQESQEVRKILDRNHLQDLKIFVSGNLDEYAIEQITHAQAPVEGFGVGTKLATSADAPYLECVYKLQEYGGQLKQKRSAGKSTLPGSKQIYRASLPHGEYAHDILALTTETISSTHPGIHYQPLLTPLMKNGKRLSAAQSLDTLQKRVLSEVLKLPKPLRALHPSPSPYPVRLSPKLEALSKKKP